jgi:hypothetical protein
MAIIARNGARRQRLRPEVCRICGRPFGIGVRVNRHPICLSCATDTTAAADALVDYWDDSFGELRATLHRDSRRRGEAA